jgi:hypothetical protein
MDLSDPLELPRRSANLIDVDLVEVDAAILMVSSGMAQRVCLSGLRWPEIVAPTALAHAQAAAVAFRIDRSSGRAALIFGAAA